MPEHSQKPKLIYSVIFDTNTLIFGHPFRSEVVKLIETFKDHPEVELNYFIPKVVEEEFKSKLPKRMKDARSSYGNSIKEINGLMEIGLLEIEKVFSEEEIRKAGEKALEKYGIKTLDTPSIGLPSILNKAIYHKPPFRTEGDSGFKDELIAETVKAHTPGLSNSSTVVFICSDGYFKDYLEGIAKEFKFKVYQSVEEFESELKLNILLTGGREKLVNSLQAEAEEIFFRNEDKSTLFYKEAWEKINREFPTLFSNPQPKADSMMVRMYATDVKDDNLGPWIPSGKAKYNIFKPLYIGKKDMNTLIWESLVSYYQDFEKEIRSSIRGLEGFSFTAKTGAYSLEFKVEWTVKLAKMGKLNSATAEVVAVDQVKDTFNLGWESLYQTPVSGPTTISGTVTLSDVNETKSDY